MVARWHIIVIFSFCNLFSMEKLKKHGHSKSEPAVEYGALIEMKPILPVTTERRPLIPVVPEVDVEKGESITSEEVIPLNQNKELAEEVEKIMGQLQSVKDQLVEPEPIFVPITLKEKIKYYCYRTKQWVSQHKGKVTLIIIGGALCVYFGYYIGIRGIQNMTDTCDRARDKAEDVIDLVDQALPFCKKTFEQCREVGTRCDQTSETLAILLTLLKNGTCALAKEIAKETLVTCNEMLDVCRKMTDFGYHPQ